MKIVRLLFCFHATISILSVYKIETKKIAMKNYSKYLLYAFIIIASSCTNEQVDTSSIGTEDAITVNSEFYNNIERVADKNPDNKLVCIDFIYAFTLNIFDEELELSEVQIISSDLEFSNLLGSLEEGYSISLSYPINSITNEGEIVEVTNNDDLKAIIDTCLKEEVITYCNGLLTQLECVWKVTYNEEGNNDFENAFFDVDDYGAVSFFHDENEYFGTWIAFYIEDKLHLNISLDDNTLVAENWNFDWKATIIDSNNMQLQNNSSVFLIEKECVELEPCSAFEFEACELNQDEGIAEFYLEDYITCVANYINYEVSENTIVTFHEILSDAENNINALPTSPYTNTINPQFISVRLENIETFEVVFTSIEIIATDCED